MSKNVEELKLPGSSPPQSPYIGWQAAIARYFKFADYKTNFKTETLAGITTFMTMGYILVVNPIILSNAIFLQKQGDLFTQLAVATGIAAAVGTLCMAILANYPFGLAPGMGYKEDRQKWTAVFLVSPLPTNIFSWTGHYLPVFTTQPYKVPPF